MPLADELKKLQELKDAGTLTAEEFDQAKASLLASIKPKPEVGMAAVKTADGFREVANNYVNYHMILGVAALVLAAVFIFGVFLPGFNSARQETSEGKRMQEEFKKDFDRRWNQIIPERPSSSSSLPPSRWSLPPSDSSPSIQVIPDR